MVNDGAKFGNRMNNNEQIIFDLLWDFLIQLPIDYNSSKTTCRDARIIIQEFMKRHGLSDDEYNRPSPKKRYNMKVKIISRTKGKPVSYDEKL